MTPLNEASARLKSWCVKDALPFWAKQGKDARGGVHETITIDGVPVMNSAKRVRVQARQAYAFAHASYLGWTEVGRQASDHAFDFLLTKGTLHPYDSPGFDGFMHTLGPNGEVLDERRDTYDHAFVLLACAWRMIAFGDEEAAYVAARCFNFLESLKQRDGSYLEGVPPSLPRRQNPHMHLFEALMALTRATGEAKYQDAAAAIYTLFSRHFFDERSGVLLEFFNADWSPDSMTGQLIEPGHMAEWCWLLDQWQDLSGEDVSPWIVKLYIAAEKLGLDGRSGFLVDECTTGGDLTKPERRTWVQTEYIKATLVQARRGDRGMVDKAADLIDRLIRTYLATPIAGGWYDRYDARGEVMSRDMPQSTFYHLLSLAAEADRTSSVLD